MFNSGGVLSRRTVFCFVSLSLLVAATHMVVYNLSDIRSSSNSEIQAWILLATYLLVLNIPTALFFLCSRRFISFTQSKKSNNAIEIIDLVERYFIILFLIAVIGTLLHWHAKLQLVNGNFNGCWASLRSAWLNESVRNAMSDSARLESILGYLLTSPVYLGLFSSSAVITIHGINTRNLFFFFAFSLLGFLSALAIVSRSGMMLLVVIVFLGCMLPYLLGRINFKEWFKQTIVLSGLFTLLGFAIVLGIFANTMKCSQPTSSDSQKNAIVYEEGFLDELPIKRVETPTALQRSTRKLCGTCNTVFMYINHGIYNFATVLDAPNRGDPILFAFATHWAQRLRLIDPDDSPRIGRVYGRGGVTLPGAAFHDFGRFGVVAVALTHGFLILLAIFFMRKKGGGGLIGLALYVAAGFSLAVAGLFVGPALIGFPFAIFSIMVWGGMILIIERLTTSR